MGKITKPFQLLEITIISAQDLEPKRKKKMRTYATAWINPARKLTTIVDTEGGSNPTWNDKFVFRVDEEFLRQDTSSVQFEIFKVSWFRDSLIGTVRLLVGNLFPPPANPNDRQHFGLRFAAVQVRRPSGRPQGILNIGVAVLDSSMRSMPLYQKAVSAVGYRHLMEENNHPRSHSDDDEDYAPPPMQVLRRSRSDRSEFLGLDTASMKSSTVAIPRKKGRVVDDDKESSILSMSWYPPPLAEETNAKKGKASRKKDKVVDDDKESSILSMSWYRPPPPPPAVTEETNAKKGKASRKKDKVDDDKESSILSMSWYRPPPSPPPVTEETDGKKGKAAASVPRKKGKVVDDDKESSILSMSWYRPPVTEETDAKKGKAPSVPRKKGKVVDDDKESSILSMSWYRPPPPPPLTEETNAKKGKASSVINVADPKYDGKYKSFKNGKANSVVSDSIMIKDLQYKMANKSEEKMKNGPQFDESPNNNEKMKNGPQFDESPTKKEVDGKPNTPKINYDYGGGARGNNNNNNKLVIGGGPYKAGSMFSDSEVGPSPSEVAAAMAEKPRYPLEDSVLDGWSLDESVEGLRSRLERWRTELPPLYDHGGYAASSSFGRSSSQFTAGNNKRGKESGLLSCFSNLFGMECQCVCGKPKQKRHSAAKGRLQSPSPFR